MRIQSVKNSISKFIYKQKTIREEKFFDKYITLDKTLDKDIWQQLYPTRKGIAEYAKSKGVTVEISDAEQKVANEIFKDDLLEKFSQKAGNNKIEINVKPQKPIKTKFDNNYLVSYSRLINKDNNTEPYIYTMNEKKYEDGFLRAVYRCIEECVKHIKTQ